MKFRENKVDLNSSAKPYNLNTQKIQWKEIFRKMWGRTKVFKCKL